MSSEPEVAVGAVGAPVSAGLANVAYVERSGGVYVNCPLELLYATPPVPEALAFDAIDIDESFKNESITGGLKVNTKLQL